MINMSITVSNERMKKKHILNIGWKTLIVQTGKLVGILMESCQQAYNKRVNGLKTYVLLILSVRKQTSDLMSKQI